MAVLLKTVNPEAPNIYHPAPDTKAHPLNRALWAFLRSEEEPQVPGGAREEGLMGHSGWCWLPRD